MYPSMARRAAQERDLMLVRHALAIAATACPFAMRVVYQPDRFRMLVVAGTFPTVTLAIVDAHQHDTPEDLAVELGVAARDGYLALVPPAHDHQLGEN